MSTAAFSHTPQQFWMYARAYALAEHTNTQHLRHFSTHMHTRTGWQVSRLAKDVEKSQLRCADDFI